MSVFVVAYDLRKPGQNYPELIGALEMVGVEVQRSVWLIEVNQTATQIRDAVSSHIDRNDRVLVIEIADAADWAIVNGLGISARWLKARRP